MAGWRTEGLTCLWACGLGGSFSGIYLMSDVCATPAMPPLLYAYGTPCCNTLCSCRVLHECMTPLPLPSLPAHIQKSFEEMQARQAGLRATQAASAASAAGGGSGNAGSAASGSDEEGAASSVPGERRGQRTKHSVWADNLRGRFVEDPDSKAEPPPVQQTAGSSGTSTQPRQQLATPGSASGSGGVAVGTRGAASGKGSSGYVDRAVVLPAPSPAGQMGGHAVRRGASDQQ